MNKIHFRNFASLVIFLLSGCVIQQGAKTAVAPPAAPGHLKVTLAANRTATLDRSIQANPDCTPRGIPDLRISGSPLHGTAVVTRIEDFPSYPAANPRSSCNTKKLPGAALLYTPDSEYRGQDSLNLEIVNADGLSNKIYFDITVQ
jgi:hypothetical protein